VSGADRAQERVKQRLHEVLSEYRLEHCINVFVQAFDDPRWVDDPVHRIALNAELDVAFETKQQMA
jgi:hypothetical protein